MKIRFQSSIGLAVLGLLAHTSNVWALACKVKYTYRFAGNMNGSGSLDVWCKPTHGAPGTQSCDCRAWTNPQSTIPGAPLPDAFAKVECRIQENAVLSQAQHKLGTGYDQMSVTSCIQY